MAQSKHKKRGQEREPGGLAAKMARFIRSQGPPDRIVFKATAFVEGRHALDVRRLYMDYVLGTGAYEHLGETRLKQGVPFRWRYRGHSCFEGDHDLNDGDGFYLAIRSGESLRDPFLMRFSRLMRLDDLGALKRLQERGGLPDAPGAMPGLNRSDNKLSEYVKEVLKRDDQVVFGVLTDHFTMVQDMDDDGRPTRRFLIRHVVEMIAPPDLVLKKSDRTLYCPDPWSKVMDFCGPTGIGAWRVPELVRRDADLDVLNEKIADGYYPIVMMRGGGNLPTQDAAISMMKPIIDAMAGMARFLILTDEVSDEAIREKLGPNLADFLPGGGIPPGTIVYMTDVAQDDEGHSPFGLGLNGQSLSIERLTEGFVSRASEAYQVAGGHEDGIEAYDEFARQNRAKDEGRAAAKEILSKKMQAHLEEAAKLKREVNISKGQIEDLQAEVKRADIAHKRTVSALEDRIKGLEAEVGNAASEATALRESLGQALSRAEESERLLKASSGQPVEEFRRLSTLEARAEEELGQLRTDYNLLEADNRQVQAEAASLRQRLHAAGVLVDSLGGKVAPGARAESDDRRERMLAVLGGNPSLEQSLQFIQETFGDRVTVLNSAMASAREADEGGFLYRSRAFGMLKDLATSYWEALSTGAGDQKAREIFGKDGYAARESDTGEGNERMRRDRTFVYKGTSVYMGRHLKIGYRDSVQETLRVHFHWDSEENRIVIGHCGSHLWKLGF